MASGFKKNEVELELLTDIDILFTVEKGTGGGICHSINRYEKTNDKYMKNYDKNKESSHLKYWDVNNLYGWTMPQKLPANSFKCVEDFEFDESSLKSYDDESDEGYLLEVDVQHPEKLRNFTMIYHFYLKKLKLKSLLLIFAIKLNMSFDKKFKTSIKSWINF